MPKNARSSRNKQGTGSLGFVQRQSAKGSFGLNPGRVSEIVGNKAKIRPSDLLARPIRKVDITAVEDQTDYAALLAWADSGMPDSEIHYPEDAPPTTREQWGDAREATFRFKIK